MRFPPTKQPVSNIKAVKIEAAALKSIKISLAKLWLGLIFFQHMNLAKALYNVQDPWLCWPLVWKQGSGFGTSSEGTIPLENVGWSHPASSQD